MADEARWALPGGLVGALRESGPVNPAVQLRMLLGFGRDHDWAFEVAWKYSFERLKMPHDTEMRKEWRKIIGAAHDDTHAVPTAQRDMWRSAYERTVPAKRKQLSAGMLTAA